MEKKTTITGTGWKGGMNKEEVMMFQKIVEEMIAMEEEKIVITVEDVMMVEVEEAMMAEEMMNKYNGHDHEITKIVYLLQHFLD